MERSIKCSCGSIIRSRDITRHIRSIKHRDFLENNLTYSSSWIVKCQICNVSVQKKSMRSHLKSQRHRKELAMNTEHHKLLAKTSTVLASLTIDIQEWIGFSDSIIEYYFKFLFSLTNRITHLIKKCFLLSCITNGKYCPEPSETP